LISPSSTAKISIKTYTYCQGKILNQSQILLTNEFQKAEVRGQSAEGFQDLKREIEQGGLVSSRRELLETNISLNWALYP
jgi:hypothetical protein